MCMRSMQTALEKTHHLKYKARLQYGLFLKGIGLSMDDAIRFFRGEFTQSHIDADKFDKEYTYGIRYNYGKEGKQKYIGRCVQIPQCKMWIVRSVGRFRMKV